MIGYELSGFGYVQVQGADHRSFLQNLLTQDVTLLDQKSYLWSALLTPKSKLVAWFKMVPVHKGIQLWMPSEVIEAVYNRLDQYIITEDVTLDRQDKAWQAYLCQEPGDMESSATVLHSDDFMQPMFWVGAAKPCVEFEPMSGEAFDVLRAQSGYPLWGRDFDDLLVLEVPFMHRGVSFTKGCYVGQETIARLHGRGMNVGKHLVRFKTDQVLQIGQALSPQVDVSLAWVTSVGKQDATYFGLAWLKRKTFEQNWMSLGIEVIDKPVSAST